MPGWSPSRASSSGWGRRPTRCAARSPTCAPVGVDIVTLGQYLRPERAAPAGGPLVDARGVRRGTSRSARRWASRTSRPGPLVRSSYHARAGIDHMVGAPSASADKLAAWPSGSASITADLAEWWAAQPMFFVATAPSERRSRELSPKGHDTLRILSRDPGRVPRPDGERHRDDLAPPRQRPHHVDGVRVQRRAPHLADLRHRHGARARIAGVRRARRPSSPSCPVGERSSTSPSTGSRRRAATRCR